MLHFMVPRIFNDWRKYVMDNKRTKWCKRSFNFVKGRENSGAVADAQGREGVAYSKCDMI